MDVAVETRYRVTVDGTVLDLGEGEATALMEALAARLLPRVDVTPVQTQVHVLAPDRPPRAAAEPVALPAGAPPADEPPVYRVAGRGLTPAGERKLREMHAAGTPHTEMARVLGIPVGSVSAYCHTRGLTRRRAERHQPPPEPEPNAPAEPSPARLKTAADGWTHAETKALIRVMGRATGGTLKEAREATGHTILSYDRRWRHLKQAGLMTVEQYLSSPESTMDGTPA